MATATIPLAKGYDPEKLEYPAYVSRKYDGVPIKIGILGGEIAYTCTRSGKPIPSCDNYMEALGKWLKMNPIPDCTIVAEVTHNGSTNFKDTSGIVRRHGPQEDLEFNVFDIDVTHEEHPFSDRLIFLYKVIDKMPSFMRAISQRTCYNKVELLSTVEMLQTNSPDWEGLIARSGTATFKPNSRHWDYQKIVVDPTVDLQIIGFEEAMSKDNKPLGMVGRLIARYNGENIGIGPGKLTHKERKALWEVWYSVGCSPKNTFLLIDASPAIATIKYKRDDSYAALRQPTFQHWRPEKTEESYE